MKEFKLFLKIQIVRIDQLKFILNIKILFFYVRLAFANIIRSIIIMMSQQQAFLHKKRLKTDLAKEKVPLIFYFCQKYVKKSSKKIILHPTWQQKRSIKGNKATLFSRENLIFNQQLIKEVSNSKHPLSNFQILKRNINYLQSEESEATTKKNSLEVASHKSLAGSRTNSKYQNLAINQKYDRVIKSLTRRQITSNQPDNRNRSTMCNFKSEFMVTQARLYLSRDKNNDPPNNSYFNKLDHSVAARKYYRPKFSLKNTHSLLKKRDKPKIVGVKIQNLKKTIIGSAEASHDVLPISKT